MKFFTAVPQVTPIVSSFNEYLELFFDFDHISVGPSDVISLVVPKETHISLSYL